MKRMNVSEFERKFNEAAKLVTSEVGFLMNSTMQMYQDAGEDSWFDDCANINRLVCLECGEELPKNGAVADAVAAPVDAEHLCSYQCPNCGHGFEEPEMNMAEVFEWWTVTDYLAEKLENEGEVIYDGPDCKLWGRRECGQRIAADSVIQRIAVR